MAMRITENDKANVLDIHNNHLVDKTGLLRLTQLELIEWDGWNRRSAKLTPKGLQLINPELDKREGKRLVWEAGREERETADRARIEVENARQQAFHAELKAAGVTLFERARADKNWHDDKQLEYSVDFHLICRVEYNRSEKRYYVRTIGSSGECDPDALIEEARQAKIARDMLNEKIHRATFDINEQIRAISTLKETGNVGHLSSRKLNYLISDGLLTDKWEITEHGMSLLNAKLAQEQEQTS